MASGFIDHPLARRADEVVVQTFRHFVPHPEDRMPITRKSWVSSVILLWILGCLARRPNTYWIRLAFFPVVFLSCVHVGFAHRKRLPGTDESDYAWGHIWLTCAFRAIDLGLYKRKGELRIGEVEPGKLKTSANGHKSNGIHPSANGNGHSKVHAEQTNSNPSLWRTLLEGLAVILNQRGIGWEDGKDIYLKPESRDTGRRWKWLLQTSWKSVQCFLFLDFLDSTFKLLPGFDKPRGATIFAFGRNPIEKYFISCVLSFMTGLSIIRLFGLLYHICSLVGVGLLFHPPASWPPLFDNPCSRTSMHDFWSRGWHQFLRRAVLVLGRPLESLFGFPGLVIGSFITSGFYHSWGLYTAAGGPDYQNLIYFTVQPLAFLFERLYRRITGRRLGGFLGGVWVYLWIVVGAQWCINAWHARGYLKGILIPPRLSPTQRILFPALTPLAPYLRPFFYVDSA
ncbi:uncharacterized protein EI90DRAFT_3127325 [Cantharellus anzutake]|uniref:uncharacterized protein n=1 Tax=Cantharellus anzutake TaxID=1750568 RepID=UPI0019037B85|nr:uncharacterized protein EI90DRAFT_3127325 [Cantharellus anzutake]KAF8327268.1 hypothetical protein EI90DRAFT_3127325 [Cantharellus anzutake]